MKEYKTWEVIKMITENRNLQFTDGDVTLGSDDNGILMLLKTVFEEESLDDNVDLDSEWELVKQPVTFEEVLNSDKKCRVEHELIDSGLDDEITSNDNVTLEDYQTLKEGNYMELHNLISVLPWILSNEEFKQVLKEGKWYLED